MSELLRQKNVMIKCFFNNLNLIHNKGKVILLQAQCSPEGGQRYSSNSSMTAALDGAEWSAPCPGRLYPWEGPGTHFTGGWLGPRAGLDERKISSPPGSDPRPSSPQSVAILTELPGQLGSLLVALKSFRNKHVMRILEDKIQRVKRVGGGVTDQIKIKREMQF